jgi:hydroxyacylglutathione hydrolase
MLKIIPLSAFNDNYIWLAVNDSLSQVVIVDPGDASPVFDFLNQHDLTPIAILVTHKHADHTGGINALLNAYPNMAVYAHPIENVPATTHFVKQDEVILIDQWSESFRVIHIPGHTLGHVAYYAHPILFSGDTLFGAGCGRVFEGTAEQMLTSLNKLAALPADTLVYCGHEYTLANLHFALHVEPGNEDIQQRIEATERLLSNHKPSLPSTMGLEKKTNPFLRCMQQSVISSVEAYVNRQLTNTVDVFHELREWKNTFKL